MTILFGIFLGLLQGLTEFLPVSSSGHLVLLNLIFGTECNFVFFSILLHFATLFAVVVVLRKEIIYLFKNIFSKQTMILAVSTIPTVLIVCIFKDFFDSAFTGIYLPICFMITAVLLCVAEFVKTKNIKINYKIGLLIGIAQGIAVLPGISRSGATIGMAVICGVDKNKATKFSFLLSIPIIIGSMLYEILSCVNSHVPIFDTPILPTIFAFLTAFIVGIISIEFMLKYLQKIKLWYFSIYLVGLSIISLFFI